MNRSSTVRLFLVADDLTGALDSTVAYCGRFGSIPVFDRKPPANPLPQLAVNTGTRDADLRFARWATRRIASHLCNAEIPYKKIDSMLRGLWAEELAWLMQSGEFSTCVFAPAFPQQGRVTRDGRQMACDDKGSYSVLPVDPLASLKRVGLSTASVGACDDAMDITNLHKVQVLVFDAETMQDLDRIATSGKRLTGPILWCGSAGLAGAMADQPPLIAPRVQRPLLAIVGTNHAVSQAQVDRALSRAAIARIVIQVANANNKESIAEINEKLLSRNHCLVTFDFPKGFNRAAAAQSIREVLSYVLPAITRPNALLVTGGETLRAVCMAVSASHLEVDSVNEPGVPHAVVCGGPWEGVEVVSKSGAFGPKCWLAEQLLQS